VKYLIALMPLMLSIALPAQAQTCVSTIPSDTDDSRYTTNGDEVTDNLTGLIWQRCAAGLSGSDCATGTATGFAWDGALQYAEQQATASGKAWRLPNITELRSLANMQCVIPAINANAFPGTPSTNFWSGTPHLGGSTSWVVFFYRGNALMANRTTSSYNVRLVRDVD